MRDTRRVAPVQQERGLARRRDAQRERRDGGQRAAPPELARVAEQGPQRQPSGRKRLRVFPPGGRQLVRDRLARVHPVEVPAAGQGQPGRGARQRCGQQPVADPVLQQPRPLDRRERLGVAAVPQARGQQRAHPRGRLGGRVHARRDVLLPGQADPAQIQRSRGKPLRPGQQRRRAHPQRRRVQPCRRGRQLLAAGVQQPADIPPVLRGVGARGQPASWIRLLPRPADTIGPASARPAD